MGKKVLITGVAGGIGVATARLFLKLGWDIIGVDRKAVSPPVKGMEFLACDLSDSVQAEKIFKAIGEKFGPLDALVNNAAMQVCKSVSEMDFNEWDELMAVNLRSAFVAVHTLLNYLARGASIINVSSVHAMATSTNISAYAASKGALHAFTRALAIEFASQGIRVNAVLPGAIDTEMLRAGLSRGHLVGGTVDERLAALADRTPLGRIGRPEEIAQAILFLADDERSSFMTGQALVVDGGATARLGTE